MNVDQLIHIREDDEDPYYVDSFNPLGFKYDRDTINPL